MNEFVKTLEIQKTHFTVSTFLMWYIDINILIMDISIFHPISILSISLDIFSITNYWLCSRPVHYLVWTWLNIQLPTIKLLRLKTVWLERGSSMLYIFEENIWKNDRNSKIAEIRNNRSLTQCDSWANSTWFCYFWRSQHN